MNATDIHPLQIETLPESTLQALAAVLDPGFLAGQRELAESVFMGLINSPLSKSNTAQELAHAAIYALIQIGHDLGGTSVYLPNGHALGAIARRRAIRAEFNGRNLTQLARKYRLTEVRIRQILSKQPEKAQQKP